MRLLVLGGTRFVGRWMAETALARGHDVTVFHRGHTVSDRLPAADEILGDRALDLDRVGERRFDAVLDACGYVPRIVRLSCESMKLLAPLYAFVSTISVYDGTEPPDERSPLVQLKDPTTEVVDGDSYGGLKALCEGEVRRAYPESHFIVRPGFVIGPGDHTDRFTYWALKACAGGRFAVPTAHDQPLQAIDARDLASFVIDSIEQRVCDTVNATGPDSPWDFRSVLEVCASVCGSTIAPVFEVDSDIVGPLCLDRGSWPAMHAEIKRARSLGLQLRPLEETVKDLLAWHKERGAPPPIVGLSADDEERILARQVPSA